MRQLPMLAAFAFPLALAACDVRQVETTPPTVTYAYSDQDSFDQVEERAEAHCAEFNEDAVLIRRDLTATGYEATFACE